MLYLEAGDKGSAEGLSQLGPVPFNVFVSDLGKAMDLVCNETKLPVEAGGTVSIQSREGPPLRGAGQGWSRPAGTL